ncbi:MAG: M3 family oligoendopeptidase [Oceanidesulfovibrio sp.]
MANAPEWDLTSYFLEFDGPEYRGHIRAIEEDIERLRSLAEQLATLDPAALDPWVELFLLDEQILAGYSHWSSYVGCLAATDSRNERYQQESGRVSQMGARFRSAFAPVMAVFREADESAVQALADREEMKDCSYFLYRLKDEASRRMDTDRERLASELGVDGISAWGRLYDTLSGRLSFTMTAGKEGEREVPMAQKRELLQNPDPEVRLEALVNSNAAWQGVEYVTAAALNAIAGTRHTLNRHRGVEDFMVEPLFGAATTRETLDAMWRAVDAERGPVLAYLRRKAALLGRDRLGFQDLSAPLPGGGQPSYTWDEASDLVVGAFRAAYPKLADFAQEALDTRHVEAEKRSGKRPGAFCTTSLQSRESHVFMTFGGTLGDVQTLAHELGHAFHSRILAGKRPLAALYPMTLAETASTFAERLVQNALLTNPATPDAVKRQVLRARLDDAATFCCDIRMRYLFERSFYTERLDGEVSAARCKELMLEAQRDAFPDVLAPDELDPMFWASKLHFYITGVSFYNFPYTFGYLLSLGLAERASRERDFTETYERFLALTGSATSEDAVRQTLGVDLAHEDFWRKALAGPAADAAQFQDLADES